MIHIFKLDYFSKKIQKLENTTDLSIGDLLIQNSDANIQYILKVDGHSSEYDLSKMLLELPISSYSENLLSYIILAISKDTVKAYQYSALPKTDKYLSLVSLLRSTDYKAELVNIIQPEERYPLSIGSTTKYKDLVISSTTKDLSNIIISIDGKILSTIYFENEIFIPDGYSYFENHPDILIMDSTLLGGHTTYSMNQLNQKIDTRSEHLLLSLPEDSNISLNTHTPIISIRGILYILDPKIYRVISPSTIAIKLSRFINEEFLIKDQLIYNSMFPIDRTTTLSILHTTICNHPNSLVFYVNNKLFKEEHILTPIVNNRFYTIKSVKFPHSMICIHDKDNYILPYINLTAQDVFTIVQNTPLEQHIYIPFIKRKGDSITYDPFTNINIPFDHPELDHPNARKNIRMIKILSMT